MKTKFLIFAAFALACFASTARAQQYSQAQTLLVASGAQASMNQNSTVIQHAITWTVTATVSACTIQVEQSATQNGSYTVIGAAQTCTSTGSYTVGGTGVWVRVNVTTLTVSGGGSLAFTYAGYTTSGTPASGTFTDGVWNVPLGACGAALTTGAFAANPANSGALSAPSMVRVAAGEQVLEVTTTAAANALTLDCDITPPTRSTTGRGATVTGYQLWYGVQTTALTSITAPVVNTITFPATGGAAAGTVATAGGSLTVLPASLQLATTTSGQCYSANVAFGTPVVLNASNVRLETTWVFNQTGAASSIFQICGLQVFYNNNQ